MKSMTVTEMNFHLLGLVRNERKLTLEIISIISLFERCGGYLKMGYSSMHQYLTRALGYSDDQAYRRLKAARLLHQVPAVAEKLKEGSLNLTQISEAQKSFERAQKETQAPVQIEKKLEILDSIANTNNFQTRALLSEELNLKPDEGERVKPQSNKTVRLEITLTQEQFNKLNEIKSLLSHKIPSQNTADVLNVLFEQFLKKHELTSKRTEETKTEDIQLKSTQEREGKPLPPKVEKASLPVQADKRSRYISAPIRRHLYQRASGCCEHRDQNGVRCSSRYQLEFDHIVPFALNGSNETENIRVVCSRHNSYLASQKNIGLETTSYFINK
jgi:hypothetical protein